MSPHSFFFRNVFHANNMPVTSSLQCRVWSKPHCCEHAPAWIVLCLSLENRLMFGITIWNILHRWSTSKVISLINQLYGYRFHSYNDIEIIPVVHDIRMLIMLLPRSEAQNNIQFNISVVYRISPMKQYFGMVFCLYINRRLVRYCSY